MVGDTGRLSSTLHIFICRVPILKSVRFCPSDRYGNLRDDTVSKPHHLLNETRALVTGVQFCCTRPLIDRPDVEKSIIRRPQARQVFLIGTEHYSSNAICMFVEDHQRSVGRRILKGKYEHSRRITCLRNVNKLINTTSIPMFLTSPTARNLPSWLIERQVAAFILSLLVQVFEVGESPHSRLVCGVEGEYGTAVSRRAITALLRPSLAVFVGVEGEKDVAIAVFKGTAVGRALKNLCEYLEVSSTLTTTAAAPAVYAKIRAEERLSKAVGEETVVPIILLRDKPDS